MRKPNMYLNIEKDLDKFLSDKLKKARNNILKHIAIKTDLTYETFDPKKISVTIETVENYSIPIKTIRYDGELWLREFPDGSQSLNIRFEGPFIK